MLKPSTLMRYNVDPLHPYFIPEVEELIAAGKVVVTLNGLPVIGVLAFSVPDRFIKRVMTQAEMDWYTPRLDDYALERVCRDGMRLKGQVAVFVEA